MPMLPWYLIATFFIGAGCALKMPIFHFTIVFALGLVIYALSFLGSGEPITTVVLWCALFGVAVQLGYVFTHFMLYLVYIRGKRSRQLKTRSDAPASHSQNEKIT